MPHIIEYDFYTNKQLVKEISDDEVATTLLSGLPIKNESKNPIDKLREFLSSNPDVADLLNS